MRVFTCRACGQLVYFENVRCERCGRALGYLPDKGIVSAVEPSNDNLWRPHAVRSARYRFCENYARGVCNWMIPAASSETLCGACRHNRVIPDLSVAGNVMLWAKLEAAKHRLIYTLLKLDLPLPNRTDDPEHGLAFAFLADEPQKHGVMTGHDNGLITLATREADDADRERVRNQMREPYRTLLGHFRHESGHYFWDVLVRDGGKLDSFRSVFGDEEQDYTAALKANYDNGPRPDWQQNFVTAYASTHPWEDFAETWAHYLHIVDTLETARSFGIKVQAREPAQAAIAAAIDFDPHTASMEQLIAAWLPLTFAVNSLNRSMGRADLYPFVLSPAAIGKIRYVHGLVRGGVEKKTCGGPDA